MIKGASLALFVTSQTVFDVTARSTFRVAAAAAASLYYWFTVPAVVGAAELTLRLGPFPGWGVVLGRGLLLKRVAAWLLDAPRRARSLSGAPS